MTQICEPAVRDFFQRASGELVQILRNDWNETAQGGRGIGGDLRNDRRRVADEWTPASDQIEQGCSDRIKIGSLVDFAGPHLLGSGKQRRAQKGAGSGQVGITN